MPYGAAGTKSTNGFAIAALVCPLVACGVGSILGIVFGHLARRQIKRTGEGGAGLALAGLIIGYATFGLAVIAVGSLAVFANFSSGNDDAVSTARDLDRQIGAVAALEGSMPRSASVIRRALRSACCDSGYARSTLGETGVDARGATDAEYESVGWRIQVEAPYAGEPAAGFACLTVPEFVTDPPRNVAAGRC